MSFEIENNYQSQMKLLFCFKEGRAFGRAGRRNAHGGLTFYVRAKTELMTNFTSEKCRRIAVQN